MRDRSGNTLKGIERVVAIDDSRLDNLTFTDLGNGNGNKSFKIATLKKYANMDRLVKVKDKILYWLFPCSLLYIFKEIYNLTYLFDSLYQKYFYELNGMDFERWSVTGSYPKFELIKHDPSLDIERRYQIKNQINIYEGLRNIIGEGYHDLTYNWWNPENKKKNRGSKEKITSAKRRKRKREGLVGKETRNFFETDLKLRGEEKSKAMWTCFGHSSGRKNKKTGEVIPQIYVKDHMSYFVPHNKRSTNDYHKRKYLAYLCNRNPRTKIVEYFKAFGYHIDRNKFALSELLQWLFRSALRNDEPIELWLPSRRMRDIFNDWLIGGLEAKGEVIKLTNKGGK